MVEQVFLQGVSFYIVIPRIGPWKYEKQYKYVFPQCSGNNINLLKTVMEVYETALCHHTGTYIYQIEPFKFRLLVTISGNWPTTFAMWGDNRGPS